MLNRSLGGPRSVGGRLSGCRSFVCCKEKGDVNVIFLAPSMCAFADRHLHYRQCFQTEAPFGEDDLFLKRSVEEYEAAEYSELSQESWFSQRPSQHICLQPASEVFEPPPFYKPLKLNGKQDDSGSGIFDGNSTYTHRAVGAQLILEMQ